jgi:hypothetical protein
MAARRTVRTVCTLGPVNFRARVDEMLDLSFERGRD